MDTRNGGIRLWLSGQPEQVTNRKPVDTLLFGRKTYELMASYWPTPSAIKDDPVVADLMNRLPKIVFSRTPEKAEWNNTRLIKDHIIESW